MKEAFLISKVEEIYNSHLTQDVCERLVHAFITCTSKLDSCNSILYGLPSCELEQLQWVQNAAARSVTVASKSGHITPILFNPIPPGGGGGGAESAHADFNFRELPWYLSNTYQMWPLLLKFIGEQDSGKILHKGYHMLPWQPHFRCHVYSNFDFLNIFLL